MRTRFLSSLSKLPFLRSLTWLACAWSFSFSNRHTGRSWGLHGQKRRIYTSRLRFALSLIMRINCCVLLWQLPISFSFLLVILLLSLIFLWIWIFEATPKDFLQYSKRETRWYILLVREPFSRYLHTLLISPRASSSLRAESTVFLSMLHSSAISRRDGKQLSVFLSLCLSKQQ